ncbi:MAG: UDP-N-acetylmuramoyl-L-alanyl-D-glutamate--2,6-diaminopimelate ligase [Holosporales bacterium]|jgi:UDP-N-acetylmuramoyl-L-alanyl-D-glutamate--2,6-diaminopimelate ligase|nr:UDP-N-acetylmuramoyl-L-alanyl-D-glutamate--2,6-diaminopimelate ligase [Holosporales bacterium]
MGLQNVKNIRINSKIVASGDIFVGILCDNFTEHVEEARRNGASIIFIDRAAAEKVSNGKEIIIVDDTRLLSSRFAKFLNSEQPEYCVAITGTNGKSSVAHFIRQFWTIHGKKAANLGTVGLFVNDELVMQIGNIQIPKLTTPDPFSLHKILASLQSIGVSHFVFEASSHALHQKRLHSVSISAAAFTNLASDHLDYHRSKEEYFNAKLNLFREILDSNLPAIVSRDYEFLYESIAQYNKNIITFGMNDKNCITAKNIRNYFDCMIFNLTIDGYIFKDIEIKLMGDFQLMNLMCAASIAYCGGLSANDIVDTLSKIRELQGRMELVLEYREIRIYIDYAHTSSAFESALSEFKKICSGRLICVFGCGGDRDKSKRIEMGKIADRLADIAIITDDNPRTEEPAFIRSEILDGCKDAIEIGDRKLAIKFAISIAKAGDCVIILGKGHESTQICGTTSFAHDDKKEILVTVNQMESKT